MIFYTENNEEGSREGTFKRMYISGRMWTVENYKKDERDGEFEEYYDNEKNTLKYKETSKKENLHAQRRSICSWPLFNGRTIGILNSAPLWQSD